MESHVWPERLEKQVSRCPRWLLEGQRSLEGSGQQWAWEDRSDGFGFSGNPFPKPPMTWAVSQRSCRSFWLTSARPFTLSLSAVLRKAGRSAWDTFTSPAYIYSKMACRWLNGTSFKMIIGCLDGFSSSRALKYGEQADNTILCALQVCPSHANVTSVKLFSSRRCLNEDTILLWNSFHRKQNCWSSAAMFQIYIRRWERKDRKSVV